MDFLKRILPGNKTAEVIDLSDAEEKMRRDREDLSHIFQRTEVLEKRFFMDQVFPQVGNQRRPVHE